MKPTVSDTKMRGRVSGHSARTVVSRVANSLSATSTWEPVRARIRDDLPALVYPTSATRGASCVAPVCLRLVIDGRQLRLSSEMRSRILRRSSSAADCRRPSSRCRRLPLAAAGLAQPGGHVRSRAISTCRRAGRLDACRWKISMITPVRSRTAAAEVARSMWRSWRGDSSWSTTTTVARGPPVGAGGASRARHSASSSSSLLRSLSSYRGVPWGRRPCRRSRRPAPPACPRRAAWQRRGPALLRNLADDIEAEGLAQALELLQRGPLVRVGDAWSCTPTSTALGRGGSVRDDMVVLRGVQDNVRCLLKRLHAARARLVRLDRPREGAALRPRPVVPRRASA